MSDSNRFGPISKTDQTAIAPVEDGSTASKAYAIGSHFMRDGQYCTAIAAIAQGASFTLNTNYTVGDVEDYIFGLESRLKKFETVSQITLKKSENANLYGDWGVTRIGNIVQVNINGVKNLQADKYTIVVTLPIGYRPYTAVNYDTSSRSAKYASEKFRFYISTNGQISVYKYSTDNGASNLVGSVVYPTTI